MISIPYTFFLIIVFTIYTDCSKTKNNSEVGAFGSALSDIILVGKFEIIFQVEIWAAITAYKTSPKLEHCKSLKQACGTDLKIPGNIDIATYEDADKLSRDGLAINFNKHLYKVAVLS